MDPVLNTKSSLFQLIVFILKTRTRLIFSGAENSAVNIGRVFVVLILIVYSISTALLLLVSTDDQRTVYYVLLMSSIPAIIISSGVFPVLKLPSSVVPGYAPLPGKQIGLLNLVYNLFRPGSFYGLIFLGITTGLTYTLGPWLFIDGLLLIIATSALDFAIKQTVLSAQTHGMRELKLIIVAGVVNSIGLGLYFVLYFFNMLSDPYVYSLYLLLFTISCVIYYTYTVELTETANTTNIFPDDTVGSSAIRSVSTATRLAYTRKHSTKPMYLLIPAFNLIIGLYIFLLADETMAEVFSLMLAFPLLPFTYVHNNFWGFFRETWLAVRLSPSDKVVKWKLFFGAVWVPMLIDAGSSFAALVFSGQLVWHHVGIYLLLIPPVMMLSYWSSLRFPRKVNALAAMNQITTFKNNTSGISSFVIVFFCYFISFMMVLSIYWIAILSALLACSLSAWQIYKCEINSHYKLQAELYK